LIEGEIGMGASNPIVRPPLVKPRGRPFEKGISGNSSGRPPGARNQTTLAAEALLDGEAEALTRKAVELALGGDLGALRLCLDRILPPRRERPVLFSLPPLRSAADAVGATAAITAAVAAGEITPSEAAELAKLVETFVRAIEVHEFDQRLRALEKKVVIDVDELERLTRELQRAKERLSKAEEKAGAAGS
jgi:hypothetical protein